jgi:hypothetical protein
MSRVTSPLTRPERAARPRTLTLAATLAYARQSARAPYEGLPIIERVASVQFAADPTRTPSLQFYADALNAAGVSLPASILGTALTYVGRFGRCFGSLKESLR